MTEVWKLDMEIHRKMILLSLADNASDLGRCWPSQTTIAKRASISTRQLRDHIHTLVDDNWIAILSIGNGRGHSTEYSLNVAKIKAEAEGVKAEAEVVKAEAHVTPTVIEPSREEEDAARAEVWEQRCELADVKSGVDHVGYWKKNVPLPEITPALQRLLKEFASYNRNLRLMPGSVNRLNTAAEIVAPLDLNDASFTSSFNEAGGIKHPDFLQELAKVAVDWAEDVRRSYGKVDLG